ncbi:MAG: RNA pseudouridine synthase [Betaproteobacteria bacterium]|nr:RNA pseudouridine synthase [Betaproteobacteria bacterium]
MATNDRAPNAIPPGTRQPEQPLATLYADQSIIVVDKPPGLLAVPGRGPDKQDCLAARVEAGYPGARTVHRLDMATSGLMVLARGADMQRRLSILFEQRRVEKRYTAIVGGKLATAIGEIDLPLIVDWPNRPRQKVDFACGKPSLTRYRVLGYNPANDTSRLELAPETGRTHQLRVHLLALGHPILGDALYAGTAARDKADRLLLHAHALAFTHPGSGKAMYFCCPAPF